jgi:hypothetical protein
VSTEPEQDADGAPEGRAASPEAAAADALKELLSTMSSLPAFGAAPPMNRAGRRAMKHANRKKGK